MFAREFRPSLFVEPSRILYSFVYGAITLYGAPFQETSPRRSGSTTVQNHIFHVLTRGIRFALYRVRSLLLTASQLISSPADTKMFQFSAFPIRRGIAQANLCRTSH